MRVERAPFLDEFHEDGRSVVMFPDGRVAALSPVVTAILDLVGSQSVSLDGLVAALVQTVDLPDSTDPTGDIERTVHFVIAELVLQEAVT